MVPSNITFDAYESSVYSFFLHFNGGLALFFGPFSMALILFKSPKVFGSYKYFLFNISFWAFCFDFYTTILYSPKIFFPALVMCSEGLFASKSNTIAYITFCLFIILIGASMVAVTTAFIYRYALLNNKVKLILSWPCLIALGLLHIVYEVPTLVFYVLGIRNQTAIYEAIITQWPNVADHYLHRGCAAIHFSVTIFPKIFICFFGIVICFTVSVVVTVIIKSFTCLKSQKSLMSPKTYKMHQQLLVSLVFQMITPMIGLIGPFFMETILVMFSIENVAYEVQIGFIMGTLHSPMNTIMMLFFIPHYRKVVMSVILKKKFMNSIYNGSVTQRNYFGRT